MYLPKWNCLTAVTFQFLLFPMGALGRADNSYSQRRFPGPFESAPTSISEASPYWEYILRDFVFKTISPPPPANNALYKRLLEAPFFGGPFQVITKDESVLLSKGDVFHLANGRWILCQEGCIACAICLEQKSPTVKWTLRRLKRQTSYNTPRYDLQLTIAPQMDESFHSRNLWPRSYVYVTSHTDPPTNLPEELAQLNREYPFMTTDQYAAIGEPTTSFVRFHKNTTPRQQIQPNREERRQEENEVFTSPFSFQSPGENGRLRAPASLQEVGDKDRFRFFDQVSTEPSLDKQRRDYELFAHRQQRNEGYMKRFTPYTKPMGHPAPLMLFYPPYGTNNTTNRAVTDVIPFTPQVQKDSHLILGMDQFGQKHLVHIVPADSENATKKSTDTADVKSYYPAPQSWTAHSIRSGKEHEVRPTYQRIFRKVLDSLNTHRNTIERFLSPAKIEQKLAENYRNPMQQETHLSTVPKLEDATTMEMVYPVSESHPITLPIDDEQTTTSNDQRNQVNYDPDAETDKDNTQYETTHANNIADSPMVTSFTYNTPLLYYTQQPMINREMRYRRYPTNIERAMQSSLRQNARPQVLTSLASNNLEKKTATGKFSDPLNVAASYDDAGKQIPLRGVAYARDGGNNEKTVTEQQANRTSTESFDIVTEEAREFNRHFLKLDSIFSKHNPQSLSQMTKLPNTSESLILKELARSVISHAKTLEGFSSDNTTSAVNLTTPSTDGLLTNEY